MKKLTYTLQTLLELNANQKPSKKAKNTVFCFQSTSEERGALSAMEWLYYDSTAQTYLFLPFYLISN